MKFIFADSLDYVDPNYNFLEDRSSPSRETYWDDEFPHEILGKAPYDGMLVSRSAIGGTKLKGSYTETQAMRFRRVGAREFLRFREKDYPNSLMFGDCGAFAYHKYEIPPYTPDEMIEFYGDGDFTHGCSVDHIIFDFTQDDKVRDFEQARQNENLRRFEITLANAEEFLHLSKRLGNRFTPMGVVQGWSPGSMAQAALRLKKMGYKYLAIGGMVVLNAQQIKGVLESIRLMIGYDIGIHILGFAKAEQIGEFQPYKITSFDTTSPLIRAFKDNNRNYFTHKDGQGLEYYSAIRIPQAIENNYLKNLAKQGVYSQEELQKREKNSLEAIREFDLNNVGLEDALEAVMDYTSPLLLGKDTGLTSQEEKKMLTMKEKYQRTLNDRPWKNCGCAICKKISVEVMIFRASNRNKRRGIHNLQIYRDHVLSVERFQNE